MRSQRFEDAAVAGARRHRDHRRRQIRHQPAKEGEAVHDRHLEIERDHVGAMFHHLFDRVFAIDRSRDHFDLRVRLQHAGERDAVVGGVVDDECFDHQPGEGHSIVAVIHNGAEVL